MTLEEAKDKVRQAIKEQKIYIGEYVIDEEGIIETDVAWYIPFKRIPTLKMEEMLIGAYYGYIVGKVTGDMFQPGSGKRIEEWLTDYEIGNYGVHDLKITRINDREATRRCIKKLHLTYHKPELENGITWKIPQYFTDKMIDERLSALPCTFRNQRFSLTNNTFKEVKASNIFEYELIKNKDAKPNEIGERID